MTFSLVVVRAFADHAIGDVIADAERCAELLRGEFAHFVVAVANVGEEG